ncbi:MAG: glycosyl hydrolase, partial [Victivallales bacterium]
MNVKRRLIASPGAILLGSCLAAGLLVQPACRADSMILLKPTGAWSVTGKDDVQQLKRLASGVGWEFEPNADTSAGLKKIGIKTIRCINVDPLPGKFSKEGNFIVDKPDRLLAHLDTCRKIGANPHIIIATGLLPELRITAQDIPEAQRGLFGNQAAQTVFGPRDWEKFRLYCEAYFKYVLIDQKFPEARFEVANEPDLGAFLHPLPPKPANGSRASYEAYFNLYKNVALAAVQFEKTNPGMHAKLGGPAIAWAYTFKFGDFNWAERFLRDCGEQKLKLDFMGVHYYGNISSLDGEYSATYPSFTEMLKFTKAARDRYCPGLPIWITEWGASYQTNNSPSSAINGNHIGAAWSAAYLDTMLQSGVDGALYLVTTDLRQKNKDGKFENVWGWPSLFVNPNAFGKTYPKAPYHVFDMVSRLEGTRVEATRGGKYVNCFASADKGNKSVTVMVWNYGCQIPETKLPVENAVHEAVTLRIREAEAFFGTRAVRMKRWLVSETVSNAYQIFQKEGKIDSRSEL